LKVVILAGGLGTRISEETSDKPKPMVLVNDKPILWHLMNIFVQQEFTEFIIAIGYKGEVIRNWIEHSDCKFQNFKSNSEVKCKFEALQTGLQTQTGGRIKKCLERVGSESVLVTYGDGLGNIDLKRLLEFHKQHGKLATVTAVRPPARFGYLQIGMNFEVTQFGEKNQAAAGWINGGFFVLEPEVLNFIKDDEEAFESGALPKLAQSGQLIAYQHEDFWQPMDTNREKEDLTKLAQMKIPPWLTNIVT
jgi:glucose-1-phosphate cytidylyltransferase